ATAMQLHDGSDPTLRFGTDDDGPRGHDDGRGDTRAVTAAWSDAHATAPWRPVRSVAEEAMRAGAFAAVGGALALTVADLQFGEPLMTPALFGYGVARVLGSPALAESMPAALVAYAVVHLAAFVTVGAVAVAIVRRARRARALLGAALLLGAAAVLALDGVSAVLARTSPLVATAVSRCMGSDALGLLLLAGWIWHAHTGLQFARTEHVGGAEPQPIY
ncbi:MAG TPA: hypothetical protein VGD56_19650, partial [Gemmatirosa sp.]